MELYDGMDGFVMAQWLYSVRMNISTLKCNEGIDYIHKWLSTCILATSRLSFPAAITIIWGKKYTLSNPDYMVYDLYYNIPTGYPLYTNPECCIQAVKLNHQSKWLNPSLNSCVFRIVDTTESWTARLKRATSRKCNGGQFTLVKFSINRLTVGTHSSGNLFVTYVVRRGVFPTIWSPTKTHLTVGIAILKNCTVTSFPREVKVYRVKGRLRGS